MTTDTLEVRLREVISLDLPLPGAGNTAERHRLLAVTAREDISLAKLAEAHWDAVAILREAGCNPQQDSVYGVWASEMPGKPIHLEATEGGLALTGDKPFCSGIGIIDRALVTVGYPEQLLVEVDLRTHANKINAELDVWKTGAFLATQTGAVRFLETPIPNNAAVGASGWYLNRPGFWHGACGPAACWAGGVAALVDFGLRNKRNDAHTLAHLGAMQADVWGMFALLAQAGQEIDTHPQNVKSAQIRALQLRHLIVEMGTDILQRFSRAFGPAPLSMNGETARRYQEAHLYMRQSHAERDLESLAVLLRGDG